MLPTNKTDRKERPITSGVVDYFPLALAEVARVSFVGNQQHNPGQPMHWDRSKSSDHADCIARHLIERGTIDTDGLTHSGKLAWRALALLQEELENGTTTESMSVIKAIAEGEPTAFTAPPEEEVPNFLEVERQDDFVFLVNLGCPKEIASQIVQAICYHRELGQPYCYISGPMRGKPDFNYPAFDAARNDMLALGYNVISPADIDRAAGENTLQDQHVYVFRDFWTLYFIARRHPTSIIAMLDGWEQSTGAFAEYGLAKWLGIKPLNQVV